VVLVHLPCCISETYTTPICRMVHLQHHYWHLLNATDPAAGSTEHPSRPTIIVLLHASNSRDALRIFSTVGTTVPVVPECIVGDKKIDTCIMKKRHDCCDKQVSLRFLRALANSEKRLLASSCLSVRPDGTTGSHCTNFQKVLNSSTFR